MERNSFTGAGNNQVTSITLNEAATSFERLRVYGMGYANTPYVTECPAPSSVTGSISLGVMYYCVSTDSNPLQFRTEVLSSNDALTYNRQDGKFIYYAKNGTAAAGSNNTDVMSILKVIGINRTAGV